MPRKTRADAQGALHHIIVRRIERAGFNYDADRDDFLTRRLELSLAGVSRTVKRGGNDVDFQDFLGIIDSSGITCKSPETHQHNPSRYSACLSLTYMPINAMHQDVKSKFL